MTVIHELVLIYQVNTAYVKYVTHRKLFNIQFVEVMSYGYDRGRL
jgi:hypothetical protein